MQLPVDTRTAGGDPYDLPPLLLRAVADATGTCTITTDPVPEGYRWLLDYVTISCTTAAAPTFTLYVDAVQASNIIDGTSANAAGGSAVAPYVPPRHITQGQTLIGVWHGCNNGDACSMRVERRLQRSGS